MKWIEKPVHQRVGINIKNIREWKGFTQKEVAEKLNINLHMYKQMENGKTQSLTIVEAFTLIKLFKCNVEEIIPTFVI